MKGHDLRIADLQLRAGQPALLSRFDNQTLRIWEKHGIRQVGFWATLIGKSSQEITDMLAWNSTAAREKRWALFSLIPNGSR